MIFSTQNLINGGLVFCNLCDVICSLIWEMESMIIMDYICIFFCKLLFNLFTNGG